MEEMVLEPGGGENVIVWIVLSRSLSLSLSLYIYIYTYIKLWNRMFKIVWMFEYSLGFREDKIFLSANVSY